MQKKTVISPLSLDDREPVMDIFNHYVVNTFAAFPEEKLPYEAFDQLLARAGGLPDGIIKDQAGEVLGFAQLRPHNPLPVFAAAAEWACFIHPDHLGKGYGKELLCYLQKKGMDAGIRRILAPISSLNPKSIEFHAGNGFVGCGRFIKVGRKKGKEFDLIWMQKELSPSRWFPEGLESDYSLMCSLF